VSGEKAALIERVRARDATLVEVSVPTVTASVGDLVVLLAASDPLTREAAAVALGSTNDAQAVKPLRDAARDTDSRVRAAAVAALVMLGREALLPEIVKSLRSDDPRIVVGAAVVLGRVRERLVVPNLVEAFKTDDVSVGAAVAWALGQIGDRAVLPWLVAALGQGFAAAAVAEALGHLGDPRAVESLLSALSLDNSDARAAVARAWGRIAPLDEPLTKQVVGQLTVLATDVSPRVRLSAALSLYELGEGGASLERALEGT